MVALVEPPEPGAMVNAEATPAPDKVTVPPRPGALQTQADFSGQASHQTSGPRHDCFDDLPVSQRCDLKDAQGSNHNPNVDNLKAVRGLFHGRSCLPHP